MSGRAKGVKFKILYPDFLHRCKYCDYEIRSKTAMGLHLKMTHNINKKLSDLCISEKFCNKFVCGSCREWFQDKVSLENHKLKSKHLT